jgi:hypothetical protein
MYKPKILWVGEATYLHTGYSVYGRELLNRLYNTNKYQIAEQMCYAIPNDQRINSSKWRCYANGPLPNNQSEHDAYMSTPTNQFGYWRYHDICLDFEPDLVISITDPWMHEYQFSSPYRRLHKHIVMPTVDSHPQNPSYIQMYGEADRVAAYSTYGKRVLEEQSNHTINIFDVLRPGFDKSSFHPICDRQALKEKMLLPVSHNAKIIGTVMRNQKRKLYDDLFLSFRKYLDKHPQDDTYLYCHTSYPDMGFNIPRLLKEHRIANRVLFTYICSRCKKTLPAFFSDVKRHCPFCNNHMSLPTTQLGASNQQLGEIYNLFDVYVQYAQAEGAGMPAVEAAGCGVPVMEVDFSAMEDYVQCVKGTPIPVQRLYREVETHFYRAYPDNDIFVEQLREVLEQTSGSYQDRLNHHHNALSFFNWDEVAAKWEKMIDSLNITESLWRTQPFIHRPNKVNPNLPNPAFVENAIVNITGKPEIINTFVGQRMLRDLNYGSSLKGFGGLSYNDESFFGQQFKFKQYTRDDFINELLQINNDSNNHEHKRLQKLQGKYNPHPAIRMAKPDAKEM